MKTTLSKILIVLLVLSSVLNIAASPNDHRIKFTPFSGTEVFVGADTTKGTIKIVDGKAIAKGLVAYFVDDINDPRVSGDVTATINYVYDGPPFAGTGPVWGTEYIQNTDLGGAWNVRFTGYNICACSTVIHGHGSGEGAFEGLKAVWEIVNSCAAGSTTVTTAVNGYIIEHE